MTELERRALLGDREAQEECTRQGIVLPCPLGIDHKIRVYNYDPCDGYQGNLSRWRIQCECGICLENENLEKLKGKWNTRAAPPVMRCRTCGWVTNSAEYTDSMFVFCAMFKCLVLKDGFCISYRPKEEKES